VRVGGQCDRDPGVAEGLLEYLGMLPRLLPERCEGVPEVVEADVGELCALEVQGGSEPVMQPTGPPLETQVLWPGNSVIRKNEGND
jgi:hypothetical protein